MRDLQAELTPDLLSSFLTPALLSSPFLGCFGSFCATHTLLTPYSGCLDPLCLCSVLTPPLLSASRARSAPARSFLSLYSELNQPLNGHCSAFTQRLLSPPHRHYSEVTQKLPSLYSEVTQPLNGRYSQFTPGLLPAHPQGTHLPSLATPGLLPHYFGVTPR